MAYGTCRFCNAELPTDGRGRMPQHNAPDAWRARGHQPACPGVGRQSRENSAKVRDSAARARHAKRIALVEPFRLHAAVALDAAIAGIDYPDTDILLRVSLHDYVAHYPEESRAVLAAVRWVARRNVGGTLTRTGDCYCLFCGVLVLQRLRIQYEDKQTLSLRRVARASNHVVECALRHLAFGLKPTDPKVRRLPDEWTTNGEDDARVEPGGAG